MLRHHVATNEKGWLEAAMDEPVEVVLTDGETLTGVLRGSDDYAIMVETAAERSNVLVYKREIRLVRR
jgi:small nuclear ribonucleoprotein (snRNP)-like protein